jgi:hypothetical protein
MDRFISIETIRLKVKEKIPLQNQSIPAGGSVGLITVGLLVVVMLAK